MDKSSKLYDSNIEKANTDVGYDKDEIKQTSTQDLIMLRKATFSYLKSPNLKKRNPNYLKLFKRITEELHKRKLTQEEKLYLKSESFSNPKDNEDNAKNRTNFDYKYKGSLLNDDCKESKNTYINAQFLKRKRANTCESPSSIDIPSFLQDKYNKGKDSQDEEDLVFNIKIESKSSYDFNDYTKESYHSSKDFLRFLLPPFNDFLIKNYYAVFFKVVN